MEQENTQPKKKSQSMPIIIAFFLILILTGLVGYISYKFGEDTGKNGSQKSTTNSSESISTQTASTASSSSNSSTTTTITTSEKDKASFSLIGSKNSMIPFSLHFKANINKGVVIDQTKNSIENNIPVVKISDTTSTLEIYTFYESMEEEFSSYELLLKHSIFKDTYRIIDKEGQASYSNQVKQEGPCDYPGELAINPPCGNPIIKLEESVFFFISCTNDSSDYSFCDEIVKSLTVEVEKH